MKINKPAKVAGGVGIVATLFAVVWSVVSPMLGTTVPIECSYTTQKVTDYTTRIDITIPYEQIPNAAFYALAFEDEEIGSSAFGEHSDGVETVDMLFESIEKLAVFIYDGERHPIGKGYLSNGDKFTLDVTEGEVIKE